MPEGKNSKQIICLADNDEDDRMMLHEVLLKFNPNSFEIIELCSAEQLMEGLCKPGIRFPDYIFLDPAMHGMSGFELIEQIRKADQGRRIKIIIYTIGSFASSMERAFSLGADFYAVKPNSYSDLTNLVKKVFQTHWNAAEPQDRIFHVR